MRIDRRVRLAAATLSILLASPAAADIKAGVDAWNAGDYKKALDEWRPLANRGNANAQYNMGQAYKLGRGVPADPTIARSWFEKAAQQGHDRAQSNLGLLLFEAGDRKTAMYWIRKAAERGDPRAQYVYGTALFNGDGVPKDWPRAYAMMTRAVAAGVPRADASLALMDQHMLAADRQRGAELARQMERGAPALAARDPSPVPPGPKIAVEARATEDADVLSAAAAPAPKPAPKVRPAPRAKPAPKAPPPAASPGGRWRVQLGAYGSEAEARARWGALGRRMPALAGLRPSYERFNAFTRLRAGPLGGKADADRLCAAARAAGQDCFAVAP
jgi:cell division septation protein DedD